MCYRAPGCSIVKHLTLDLCPGLGLGVMSSSPAMGSILGEEPTLKKKKEKKNSNVLNLGK